MVAGRNSLLVGFAAAATATAFGAAYGAAAGFAGGPLDALMMRTVDVLLAVPLLVVLLVLDTILQPSRAALIGIIAFASWLAPARLVRGETLTLRTRTFIEASRSLGANRRRIIAHHLLPNMFGTIIVNLTLGVADSLLALAALGFLGLGLRPPQTDWGAMIAQGLVQLPGNAWWLIYPAAFCIVVVVVALSYLGEGLRDSVQPR
ncbi:MAG: ABC transporter permease [Acidimicrobiaceae bacterium]|nr:ABC transporter permease [Acidimicrobiaceae bacterium]